MYAQTVLLGDHGDRVHQKRHVGRDRLDDGVHTAPTVGFELGVVNPNPDIPRFALGAEDQMREGSVGEILGAVILEVFDIDVRVV